MIREIVLNGRKVCYQLERKEVKNINLRIKADQSIYMSANNCVPDAVLDEFLLSKADYILKALDYYAEMAKYTPKPKQYVDGGYDGVIPIQIVVRTLGLTSEENKLHVIDLLNQLGMWFDETIHYNKDISGFTIYSVSQQTVAVIGYADESGLVDVVADFRINYSKN